MIGTGSRGVQAIPDIAAQAGHLNVFQRTPNFSAPGRNQPLDAPELAAAKAPYPALRAHHRVAHGYVALAPRARWALARQQLQTVHRSPI